MVRRRESVIRADGAQVPRAAAYAAPRARRHRAPARRARVSALSPATTRSAISCAAESGPWRGHVLQHGNIVGGEAGGRYRFRKHRDAQVRRLRRLGSCCRCFGVEIHDIGRRRFGFARGQSGGGCVPVIKSKCLLGDVLLLTADLPRRRSGSRRISGVGQNVRRRLAADVFCRGCGGRRRLVIGHGQVLGHQFFQRLHHRPERHVCGHVVDAATAGAVSVGTAVSGSAAAGDGPAPRSRSLWIRSCNDFSTSSSVCSRSACGSPVPGASPRLSRSGQPGLSNSAPGRIVFELVLFRVGHGCHSPKSSARPCDFVCLQRVAALAGKAEARALAFFLLVRPDHFGHALEAAETLRHLRRQRDEDVVAGVRRGIVR